MVTCGGLITAHVSGPWVLDPTAGVVDLANTSGQDAGSRGRTGHGLAPDHVRSREDRTRGMLEKALEGKDSGEHRPRRPTIPGQGRVVARTDSRGEQGFETGVSAAESGEPGPIQERGAAHERGNPSRATP